MLSPYKFTHSAHTSSFLPSVFWVDRHRQWSWQTLMFVYQLFCCSLWSCFVLFFLFFFLSDWQDIELGHRCVWLSVCRFSPSAWSSMWNSWLKKALKLQLAAQTLPVPKEDTCRKMRYWSKEKWEIYFVIRLVGPLCGDWLPVLEHPLQLIGFINLSDNVQYV